MKIKSSDNIGLFDLDGSLADFDGQLMADLARLYSPEEPKIDDLRSAGHVPHMDARMRLIKSQPGWWKALPPIENGMKVWALALKLGFNCKVLTKGPRSHSLAWKEKLDWAYEHLGKDVEVTITFDKSQVYGKFLYDDFMDYNLAWLQHRKHGLVVMPVKQISGKLLHPRILEYDGTNLDQVQSALTICFQRKPGEELVLPR